jgi:hypothetical protein
MWLRRAIAVSALVLVTLAVAIVALHPVLGEDVFAEQMRTLHAAGYEAITLQQSWDGWERGGRLPRKPIVLSFATATSRTTRTRGPSCASSDGRACCF